MARDSVGEVKVGRCPVEISGELTVWVTCQGRLVLVCDECDATWFDRASVSVSDFEVPRPVDRPAGNRVVRRLQAWGFLPAPKPEFVFADGDVLAGPATPEQIRAGGWGDLLSADS